MLAPRDQQQYRLFNLDRKLGSSLPSELHQALDDLELLLPALSRLQLANSITMRVLQLLPTSRSFPLKQRIARLLHRIADTVYSLPSRDHIAGLIGRCIKAADSYTRIVSLQMLRSLYQLFLNDVAIYQTLLSKLNPQYHASMAERKECVLCLGTLLAHSSNLSQLFVKGLKTVSSFHQIPCRVMLYLLGEARVESQQQIRTVDAAVSMVRQNREVKRELWYLGRVVMRMAGQNYKVVEMYHQRLHDMLPQISKQMQELQYTLYPFLITPPNRARVFTPSTVQLLDHLHYLKSHHIDYRQNYGQSIQQRFYEQLSNQRYSQAVMLLNYVSSSIHPFDSVLAKIILQHKIQHSAFRTLLKQMLAVGLVDSPALLLERISLNTTQYIILKSYLIFKAVDTIESLQEFDQIVSLVAPSLQSFTQLWQHLKSGNSSQYQPLIQTLQKSSSLLPYSSIASSFLTNQQQDERKKACSHLIPSGCMELRFWFAFLSKPLILTLCSQ